MNCLTVSFPLRSSGIQALWKAADRDAGLYSNVVAVSFPLRSSWIQALWKAADRDAGLYFNVVAVSFRSASLHKSGSA
jgi:hypothetical protein